MKKLLTLKLRIYRNSLLRSQDSKKKIVGLFVFLALAGGLIFLLLTRVPRGQQLGPAGDFLLARGLQIGFLLAFFYLLFGGINTALNSLFLSGDLNLLRCTPIPSRTVFTYKFVSAWIDNSKLISAVAFPLLVGYGIYAGVGLIYYLVMLIGVLAFTGVMTGISSLLTLIAVKLSPPNLLRRTLKALGPIVGAVLYGIFYINFYTGESGVNVTPGQLERLKALFFHPAIEWLPGGWLASSLSYFGTGGSLELFFLNFGLLLGTAEFLFLINRNVLADAFSRGVAEVREVKTNKEGEAKKLELSRSNLQKPLIPFLAVAKKEARVYLRDLRSVSSLWYFLAMTLVVPIILFYQSNQVGPLASPYFGFIPAWLFLYMFGGAFSSLAFFSERGNTSSIFTSPLAGTKLVQAKIITYFLPTILIVEVYHVVGSILVGSPLKFLLIGSVILPFVAFGATSLGVGLVVSFGRPNVIDPKKCLPGVLRFLMFPIVAVYLSLVGASVVCALHPASLPYVDYFGELVRQIGGGILVFVIPLTVSHFSIKFAGRRFLSRDW